MQEDISGEPGCLKNIRVSSNLIAKRRPQLSWYALQDSVLFKIDKLFVFLLFVLFFISISPENTVASAAVSRDGTKQDCEYAEKCSQSSFRSVAELSLGSERTSDIPAVDMVFLLAFSSLIYLNKVLCQEIKSC